MCERRNGSERTPPHPDDDGCACSRNEESVLVQKKILAPPFLLSLPRTRMVRRVCVVAPSRSNRSSKRGVVGGPPSPDKGTVNAKTQLRIPLHPHVHDRHERTGPLNAPSNWEMIMTASAACS